MRQIIRSNKVRDILREIHNTRITIPSCEAIYLAYMEFIGEKTVHISLLQDFVNSIFPEATTIKMLKKDLKNNGYKIEFPLIITDGSISKLNTMNVSEDIEKVCSIFASKDKAYAFSMLIELQ